MDNWQRLGWTSFNEVYAAGFTLKAVVHPTTHQHQFFFERTPHSTAPADLVLVCVLTNHGTIVSVLGT